MSTYINIFLAVYAALFPIVNPLGGAPIFLTFVRRCSPKTRELLARKVAIYGFIVLLCSLLFGAQILLFFGVTMPVLHLAGGLVVASVGWHLLNQSEGPDKKEEGAALEDEEAMGYAFYPLTLPLTMGPGAIATTIALSAGRMPTGKTPVMDVVFQGAAAVGALAAIALTIYFAFREAGTIERVLGKTGTNVLVRLFAFIVLTIGLQMLWAGTDELITEVMAKYTAH